MSWLAQGTSEGVTGAVLDFIIYDIGSVSPHDKNLSTHNIDDLFMCMSQRGYLKRTTSTSVHK